MLGRNGDAAKPLIPESRRCIISKLRKMNLITITLNDFKTAYFVVTTTMNLYHESLIESSFKCIEIVLGHDSPLEDSIKMLRLPLGCSNPGKGCRGNRSE